MAEKRIIEGYWDCEFCNTKGISGLTRECPNCGKPRGDHVKFYMKKERTYLDEDQKKAVSDSPDWYCEYCGSLNNGNAKFCTSCGAERETDSKNYFEKRQETEQKEAKKAAEREAARVSSQPKSGGKGKFIMLGIIAALLAFIVYSMIPKADTLKVTEFAWQYVINLEEEREVLDSDWYLPADGRLDHTAEEVHHYETVTDGYQTVYETVDKGNGTFEEVGHQEAITHEEPVYDTKYYFWVYRWFDGRKIETGANDHEPYWGEVDLASNEREGSRDEYYQITAQNKKDKEKTYRMSKEDWESLKIGDVVDVEVLGGMATLKKD